MKKYMVVYIIEGEQHAIFSDDMEKVEQFRMDTECGMGGYAEVYVRSEPTEENDYQEAYELFYC